MVGSDKRFSRASHGRQKLVLNVFKHPRGRKWLGYVMKAHLPTQRGAQRVGDVQHPAQVLPDPPQGPSEHQRSISRSLRITEAQEKGGIQIKEWGRNFSRLLVGLSPEDFSPRVQSLNPSQNVTGSSSPHLLLICRGSLSWPPGHIMGKAVYLFMPYDKMPRGGTRGGQREGFQWPGFVPYLLEMHLEHHYWLDLRYGAVADSPDSLELSDTAWCALP